MALSRDQIVAALLVFGPDLQAGIARFRVGTSDLDFQATWVQTLDIVVSANARRLVLGLDRTGWEELLRVYDTKLGPGAEWALEHGLRYRITTEEAFLNGLVTLRSRMGWKNTPLTLQDEFPCGVPRRLQGRVHREQIYTQNDLESPRGGVVR